MMMLSSLLFLSGFTATSLLLEAHKLSQKSSKHTYSGSCPQVLGTKDFNLPDYISTPWWNIVASPFFWNFEKSICPSATYKLSQSHEGLVDIFNSGLINDTYNHGVRYTSKGLGKVSNEKDGTLSVIFYDQEPRDDMDNYIVFKTDNKSYSYVWTCRQVKIRSPRALSDSNSNRPNKEGSYRPILWILHKNGQMSDGDKKKEVNTAIDMLKNKFNWDQAEEFRESMEYLQTKDCPEVPYFE